MTPFQILLSESFNEAKLKYDNEMKEFTNFCNSLRCPLCGVQLDGHIDKTQANLYCLSNNEEYRIVVVPSKTEPIEECITYWYAQYMYVITYRYTYQFSKTIIERFNMDASSKFRYKTRKLVFEYPGERLLFFRTRMDEEVFLKKLKTYQIFS